MAISNDRLISLENGQVSFYYKDYRDNRGQGPMKVKELPIVDFIHRFLQHVMPNSMRSSRNCGYMSNGLRRDSLAAIRAQLEAREAPQDQLPNDEPESDDEFDEVEDDRNKCPKCGHNQWTITERMRRPTVNEIYTAPWPSLLAPDVVLPDPALELVHDAQFNAQFEFW